MWQVILIVFSVIVILFLSLLKDWLVYKYRGRVESGSKDDETVIVNPEDAIAHRVIDLGKSDSSPKSKKS